jgi:hypothetical protein
MTSANPDPHLAPSSVPHVRPPHRTAHVSFWIRELPFTLILILIIAGVAYTSFDKATIVIERQTGLKCALRQGLG